MSEPSKQERESIQGAGVVLPTERDEQPPTRVTAIAHEFIGYYMTPHGCANCGGLPHTTTCFVGRFARALTPSETPR